jgi:hypothetical protein
MIKGSRADQILYDAAQAILHQIYDESFQERALVFHIDGKLNRLRPMSGRHYPTSPPRP